MISVAFCVHEGSEKKWVAISPLPGRRRAFVWAPSVVFFDSRTLRKALRKAAKLHEEELGSWSTRLYEGHM